MDPRSQQPWQGQPQQTPPLPGGYPQPTPTPNQPAYPPQPQQPMPQPYQDPNQPQQDMSIDYLNQIAPPLKQSRKPGKLLLIIFILLGLLVVVGIVAIVLSGGRTSTPVKASQLSARMDMLAKLSREQHRYLRDNDLRATNTAYTLFLANAVTDLKAPLAAAGLEKETTKSITAGEKTYSAELGTKFEDARLNVMLDDTYARQMTYELEVVQTMMRSIYNATDSQDLRSYLESADNNLVPIAKEFSEFSVTK